MKLTNPAITAALLAIGSATPALALCPFGEVSPICETGHFTFYNANTNSNCLVVLNTDTGNRFAVMFANGFPQLQATTLLAPVLSAGGPLTVRSSGQLTSCGNDTAYEIIAVRNALY